MLTHIDGRHVDPSAGPWPLLTAAGGTTVELTVTQPEPPHNGAGNGNGVRSSNGANGLTGPESRNGAYAGGPEHRRVAVVPLVDDRALRYQDWVAQRREVVRELSDGQVRLSAHPRHGRLGLGAVQPRPAAWRSPGRP